VLRQWQQFHEKARSGSCPRGIRMSAEAEMGAAPTANPPEPRLGETMKARQRYKVSYLAFKEKVRRDLVRLS
jgi:hypothetical protein